VHSTCQDTAIPTDKGAPVVEDECELGSGKTREVQVQMLLFFWTAMNHAIIMILLVMS